MKRHQRSTLAVVCTTVLFTAVGCGERPGDRLIGNWAGAGQFEGSGSDPASEMLRAAMANFQMSAEFKRDGTYTRAVAVGGQADLHPWSGAWQVVESQPDRLVIELTGTIDGGTTTRRAEIEFLPDGRAAYVEGGDDNLPKFILSRVADR